MSIQWSAWKWPTNSAARFVAPTRASTCDAIPLPMSNRMLVSPDSTSTPGLRAVPDRARAAGAEDGQAHASSGRAGGDKVAGARHRAFGRRDRRRAQPRGEDRRGRDRRAATAHRAAEEDDARLAVAGVGGDDRDRHGRVAAALPRLDGHARPRSRRPRAPARPAARAPPARRRGSAGGRASRRTRADPPAPRRAARGAPRAARPRRPTAASPASSRSSASSSGQVRWPRAQTCSPSSAITWASTPATSASAAATAARLVTVRVRPDPDVDGLGAGVGRDRRPSIGVEQRPEPRRDRGLADARQPQRHRDDRPAQAAFDEAWHDPARPTSGASRAAGRAARPRPCRRAVRATTRAPSRSHSGWPSDEGMQPGLLAVRLGERQVAPLEELPQPRFQGWVHVRRLAEVRCDRLAGEVVRRRPETAGGDDEVDACRAHRRTRLSPSRGRPEGQ